MYEQALISKFDLDYAINTNQIGCHYQTSYTSLAEQEATVILKQEKKIE